MDCPVLSRPIVLAAALLLAGAAAAQEPLAATFEVAGTETASTAVVLEGRVLAPDGSPAEGALVVSGAGGKAVADAQGTFRLDVRVPRSAQHVQVTAVGAGNRSAAASARVALPPGAGVLGVGPLVLAEGATCQPEWLPTFGPLPGTSGVIYALAVFDDGTGPALYAGGAMDVAGNAQVNYVARWDGSSWTDLDGGMDDVVETLLVFDDGSGPALYAGGEFGVAGGVAASRIARWDGSSWSALGAGIAAGVNVSVRALAAFDDGGGSALYVGGAFTMAGAGPANRIARWDGASWSALGAGTSGAVEALEVFDDGGGPALYAGGSFTTAGGGPANRIAKWDGASWSALGTGMDGPVEALEVFDGGAGPELYAGGDFTLAGGGAARSIARWNGVAWSRVGGGLQITGSSLDRVHDLATFDDGSGLALYAAGNFDREGGPTGTQMLNSVGKWNGTTWSALDGGLMGLPAQLNSSVYALAEYDAGSGPALWAGGAFLRAGGAPAKGIAAWNGSDWSTPTGGPDFRVSGLGVHDDGSGPALYVGGIFTQAGGLPCNRIAKWDGRSWSPPGSGVDGPPTVTADVRAFVTWDDGTGSALYVGGTFTSAGGVGVNSVARWDGSTWSALPGLSTSGGPAHVYDLEVFDDGSGPALYVGGHFDVVGQQTANIVKYDGTTWSGVGGGVHHHLDPDVAAVLALEVFDDGTGPALYVAGSFVFAGTTLANRIARWDGSSWSSLGTTGAGGSIADMLVFDDGSGLALYVTGSFNGTAGVQTRNIARWDGSSWSPLGAGILGGVPSTYVNDLAIHDDASGPALYAAGLFLDAGGVAVNHLARWDGSTWSDVGGASFGDFSNTYLSAVTSFDDGSGPSLVVGGSFLTGPAGGEPHIARWACPNEPPTTYCTGKTNSLGCVPFLSTTGQPSASATSPFLITAHDVLPGQAGFVIYGFQKANLGFHGGRLCVKAPFVRTTAKLAKSVPSAACAAAATTGLLERNFNAIVQSSSDPMLSVGATVHAQWRQRDGADPAGFGDGLTDAVRFTVAP